jgi:hypothetical protein
MGEEQVSCAAPGHTEYADASEALSSSPEHYEHEECYPAAPLWTHRVC